ncbi:ABC transporter transmembrane domain-containing protein [Beijerinckia indica]|uniref:Lipid A ABC exporter family, fused ATPase and inner membrane subunits n=1 Tax=Beijerinckia indica subsp. indica (strain ATCC 9039 / DSM 1715 / NCIMB 8712) TaxID=395963 RepID=B2ICB5_BEII9|nr:ABC transporter transmembrane domain-containing protein [Beijerinckia indica]ACB96712.1 lipid A ABC exporter family, fused ATPase and inner membrane subunits [Beijerinckia indica subsp. indica ATCC 9039]
MDQLKTVPEAQAQGTEVEAKGKKPSPKALLPLVPYMLRYKGRLLGAFVALTMASAATLAVPFAVRQMIDLGFSAESSGAVNWSFLALIGIVAVLALASGFRFYCVTTLGERVVADLRDTVFKHLSRLDASFYDTAQVGELLSRLTADTVQMKSAFGSSASVALRNLFLFVGAIGLMIYSSPKLSAYVLVALPIIVLPLAASGRSVRKRSRQAQDRLAEVSAYAAENLGAVRTMQAFVAEGMVTRRFASAVEGAYEAARGAAQARAALTIVIIFLVFSSVVAVLWFGAHDVLTGRMSAGLLSQFLLYAVLGASALGELSQVWSEISAAAGAAGRISEILAVKPRIVAPEPCLTLPTPGRGDIRFEAVTFSYPSRPEDTALSSLSLHVAPGETVAIVGPSGAGKSTLFQLLQRFYDPASGRILLDGVDIKQVDPADLRHHIKSVPQDPVVFGISITDNIRYGASEASDEDVRRAAEQAAADEFIRALPDGYDTKVGERGVTLSGGQRQRLAIARAILQQAPVLLLDEATSALDAENEQLVQKALENLMAERTTLVIAHRLATVLNADRILVIENGCVVEEGTHTSLIAKDGLYARLARLQFETGNELIKTQPQPPATEAAE